MATGKKSFVLYADVMHTVEKLPDLDAGQLFKHILRYVNDKDPQTDNLVVEIAFEPIKQQLKRDLIKWEGKQEQRSKAGKASAEARKKKTTENNENERPLTTVEKRSTNSTVNVNVNGNVNVKEKKSIKKSEPAKAASTPSIETRELEFRKKANALLYPSEMTEAFCDYWTESNKAGKKMRFEMQQTFDISRRMKTWARKDFNQPTGGRRKPFPEQSVFPQDDPKA